jgi:hypothetical protein
MAKTSHQVFCTPLAMIAVDEVPHLTESSVKNQTTTSIEEAKHLYREVLNCFRVVFTKRSSEKPESRSENPMVVIEQARGWDISSDEGQLLLESKAERGFKFGTLGSEN